MERSNSLNQNGVPIKPLVVDIEAATSAIAFVCSLLLPQAVLLFNYGNGCENDSGEQVISNTVKDMPTKEEKILREIEKCVLELKLKFFHKSSITDRHYRNKRALVDTALNSLAQRRLLHKSDDKAFFTTGRVSSVTTYLKFLPTPDDEGRFRDDLLKSYQIDYDEYKRIFSDSSLLPSSAVLTPYGSDLFYRPPYQTITNEQGKCFAVVIHRNLVYMNFELFLYR